MLIDFSRAVEGEFYTVDETVILDDKLSGSRDGKFTQNATLKGWYLYSDNTLAVDCVLETEIQFNCDRCGKPTTVKLKVPVSETFFKEPPDESMLPYVDEQIDLQPVIDDRVILAMPSQVLCKNSCKGLCPKCGKNLNEGKCNCNIEVGGEGESTNNPFAALVNMNNNSGGATNGSTKK